MTTYLDAWQGWLILIGLGVLSYALSQLVWRAKAGESKLSYLLGNRVVPWFPLAGSIAATWLAAQVLFVTATKAYTTGWVGVFWFTLPNVGSLILLGIIARQVRRRVPDGVTLSEAIARRSSRSVQWVYQLILLMGQVLQFTVQLVAGGILMVTVTGMDYSALVIGIAAIVLLYTIRTGIKATILTDTLQVLLVVAVIGVLGVWFAIEAGEYILAGLAGVDGTFTSLVSGPGPGVFFSFGLVTGLGLLLGPLNDQSFWQRVWAGEERTLTRSFVVGALLFSIAPLGVMGYGFAAAGAGMQVDPQVANLAGLTGWLPGWTVIPFAAAILAGIFSTADSQLSAAAAVVGHDFTRDERHAVRNGRRVMVAVALLAVGIALIPGGSVLTIFTIFAAVRMTPSAVTAALLLSRRDFRPSYLLAGLLGGALIGVPLVAYGTLTGVTGPVVLGTLLALALPGAGALLGALPADRSPGALEGAGEATETEVAPR